MTDAHQIVWDAVSRATSDPCKIVSHANGRSIFEQRVRASLQELLDAGKLAAGEYAVEIRVGSRAVSIVVRVQADLFGPASINLDMRNLDELLARE
jgi:hypothetical protein